MKKYLFSAALGLSLSCLALNPAHADEGMYMLTDLAKQNAAVMQDLGLDLEIEDVFSPAQISLKDAIVHFGGGCTAEVISPDGLLLTNHHCGYGSIQSHSTVENDYLTDGFWAKTRADELPCPGLTISYIDQIIDVTEFTNKAIAKSDDPDGTNYLSPKFLETVAEKYAKKHKIKVHDWTRLQLKPFYGSNKYYLFVKKVYSDIRMVGAPPSSIGKFGADTDNWMWPRHTGDFSMFRIYASPDGTPAEYATTNTPLKVKKYLTINIGGVEEGDYAMIMGFPGRNWRYMISPEVRERMETANFMRHHVRDARQNILMEEMKKDPEVRIYYASKYASSANYWKNAIGMNEGLTRLGIFPIKKAQADALLAYGQEQGTDKYQAAYDTIATVVKKRFPSQWHMYALYECFTKALDFMQYEPGQAEYPAIEKRVCKKMLELYMEYIPKADNRISIFSVIADKYDNDLDAFVEAVFKDPALHEQFKESVQVGKTALSTKSKADTDAFNRAHKIWDAGIMELRKKQGLPIYPNANSTLRLTYGQIKGYSPRDGVDYLPFTTLEGVMEKGADTAEFTVPAYLKQLYAEKNYGQYARKDGKMPVAFISNLDTTGGNSGSPVLNGKGELIGLNFDRNYEGLSGDIAYKKNTQRSIAADIRYVLFVIDKYAHAQRLIDEMTIVTE